jgi:hypothetical protein
MGEEGASTRLRIIDRELIKELEIFSLATSDFAELTTTGTDIAGNVQALRDLLDARNAIVRREIGRAK